MQLPRGTERQRKTEAPAARWMKRSELAEKVYADGSILLGRDDDGQLIGTSDDRHIMTIAGSRSGKSSTCLKPNLALWPSSVLCIDPKGELAMETAMKRKAMGQDVYILDPFGEVKGEAASLRTTYNPLDEFNEIQPDDCVDEAGMLGETLITSEGGKNEHFALSARNLIRGLCLYTRHVAGRNASLNDVREVLTSPLKQSGKASGGEKTSLMTHFKLMMGEGHAFDGVLAGVGGTMTGKPDDERGSIISTAIEQTAFLDSTPMRDHISQTGLPSMRVLKRKPTTIYLVLPASRMGTHARWLRMLVTQAMTALEREKNATGRPVLFILEEFPTLGYMRQVEAAAGLMAGYGVKLWTVLQDLSQLKSQYKDSWETFIGNAGVLQVFGNTDATTLEYISRALGNLQITETMQNSVTASGTLAGSAKDRQQTREVPLLAPFEVAQYCERGTEHQIIMFAGQPPAYIKRMSHQEVSTIGN